MPTLPYASSFLKDESQGNVDQILERLAKNTKTYMLREITEYNENRKLEKSCTFYVIMNYFIHKRRYLN